VGMGARAKLDPAPALPGAGSIWLLGGAARVLLVIGGPYGEGGYMRARHQRPTF